jgi:hypothetical protein
MNPQAKELSRVVASLDSEHWRHGSTWYSHARNTVRECLAMAGHDARDLKRACAVFAALSPRVTYEQNVLLLRKFLTAVAMGVTPCVQDMRKADVLCLNQSLAAACEAWLTGEPPNGPKTGAFALAVHSGGCADCDPVLDVWALRACGLDEPPRGNERDACVAAYKEHARRLGVYVHELQAAVWVCVRGAAW